MAKIEGATPGARLSATPGATPRQRPGNEGATHSPNTPRVAPALGGGVHVKEKGGVRQAKIPAFRTLLPSQHVTHGILYPILIHSNTLFLLDWCISNAK